MQEQPPYDQLLVVPWAARLLQAPNQVIQVRQRETKQTLFETTFHTPDTISIFVTLHQDGTPEDLVTELKGIFTIGDGLNGYPSTAHGGAVMAILDEVMGMMLPINVDRGALPPGPFMTAYLNTQFKAPMKSNATYLAVAKLDKLEGRKAYLSCSVQDGQGKVFVTADALFLRLRVKL